MACSRGIIHLTFSLSLFVTLYGQFPNLDDENELLMNYTTLWDLLKPQTNPYLQELSGHWSFNDTVDLSKYEEFDHTRFEGTRELSMEEVLAKVKQKAKMKANQAKVSINIKRPPTQPPEDMPSFDPDQVTNCTAQLGGTAYLSCRIRNLNNRAVSWVRKRDWHILTSAMFTYTNDERFQVMHAEGSEEWVLQIKFVQRRDAGAYECQLSELLQVGVGTHSAPGGDGERDDGSLLQFECGHPHGDDPGHRRVPHRPGQHHQPRLPHRKQPKSTTVCDVVPQRENDQLRHQRGDFGGERRRESSSADKLLARTDGVQTSGDGSDASQFGQLHLQGLQHGAGLRVRLRLDRWGQHSGDTTPRRFKCDAPLFSTVMSRPISASNGSLMDHTGTSALFIRA